MNASGSRAALTVTIEPVRFTYGAIHNGVIDPRGAGIKCPDIPLYGGSARGCGISDRAGAQCGGAREQGGERQAPRSRRGTGAPAMLPAFGVCGLGAKSPNPTEGHHDCYHTEITIRVFARLCPLLRLDRARADRVLLPVLVSVGYALGMQHLGVAQLLGDAEPVDEQLRVRP